METRAWRPKFPRWRLAEPPEGAERLARRIGVPLLVAQVLCNRGVREADQARSFLEPKLTDLLPPEALPGASQAARRIVEAVERREPVVIYGDYDVDGITAVAILHACLCLLGGDVHFYVPHRLEEGYGVNPEAVRKIVARGAKLLVTVDCGISAVEPVAEAAAAGVDVIVTDHHSLPEALPLAHTIVHPALGGYANPALSGAGVAFKLAWEVARIACGASRVDERMRNFLLDATCLAALGTIADVVSLVGENRALAVHGLRGLPQSTRCGLRALLKSAGLASGKVDAYDVGFILAPRLNACGRLGHARLAVELLTTSDPERAAQIARHLTEQNTERQRIEAEITRQAVERVQAEGPLRRAVVLASPDWHGGVIGIVASRLVERFSRPAVLIALNRRGLAQGSARSIPGFHLRDALANCAEHLVGFGGHAMAAGCRLREDQIAAFTAAFLDYADRNIPREDLVPALDVDAETSLPALGYDAAERLARLAPFGPGNPPPVVMLRSCQVLHPPHRMGRNGQTVALTLGRDDAAIRAVGFGLGDLADGLEGVHRVDVAGRPVLNTFNGTTRVEFHLRDLRVAQEE